MLKAANLDFTDDLSVEFAPMASANPLLDFLNRLTLVSRDPDGVRYVGYAYEYDVREPDYLIFAVTKNGDRREYLVPVTHDLGWAGLHDRPEGSTLHPARARTVLNRPQYPEVESAIFAPHIAWGDDVPAAALQAIAAFVRRNRDCANGYSVHCAPDQTASNLS